MICESENCGSTEKLIRCCIPADNDDPGEVVVWLCHPCACGHGFCASCGLLFDPLGEADIDVCETCKERSEASK